MYGYPEAGLNPSVFGDAVLGCLTAVSAATDLYCGRVYNFVTVPGLCAGILLAIHRSGAAGLLDVLCAAGFTVMILVPLLAAVSAFMPAGEYLRCFAGAFIIGACIGIGHLILTGGREHRVHFAVPVAASVLLHFAGMY